MQTFQPSYDHPEDGANPDRREEIAREAASEIGEWETLLAAVAASKARRMVTR